MSKTFDCINHDFLFYKLLKNNIGGKIYYVIQELYKETVSCVQLSNMNTEWFQTLYGVRQRDNLSPTLFNIYINDLAEELKSMNLGIKMGDLYSTICR